MSRAPSSQTIQRRQERAAGLTARAIALAATVDRQLSFDDYAERKMADKEVTQRGERKASAERKTKRTHI